MQEAFKIFILSTIVITLWTAFLLLQDKRSIPALNRWFAVFLLALSAPQIDLYVTLAFHGGIFLLALVASTFLWLKGPFVWIFLKILTRSQVKPSKMWIHFVPWFTALVILLLFPHMGSIIMLLGMSHMLTYLFFSIRQLINKRHYIAEVWQGFQNTAYYWLLYIIAGVMLLVTIDLVVMSLVSLGILTTYYLLDYYVFPIFSIYVLSIAVLSVYRPELLFRETSNTANEVSTLDELKEEPKQQLTDQKVRYLELNEALAQTLMQQLATLMQEQQVYRQNELCLLDLAQLLGISVHQLSELLNVHVGVNFYEYINGYRLQFACNLLKSPDCQLRILDIAFEAGFNNKNSFYRAFKEGLGLTPNQYREQAISLELKPA